MSVFQIKLEGMMQVPLEIVFENMDSSDAIRARIESEIEKLAQFHDRITSCRVVIQAPKHHKVHGGLFETRIHMTLPGHVEINAQKSPGLDHAHEDAYVTIRDAFAAARRQLQDKGRKLEGSVKQHETPPQGKIARMFYYEGYGFIESTDGSEVYFDKNSVVDADFDKLEAGQEVRFSEEMGNKGPQASTVHVIGKHHPS
jgi:cold shock CspA family protein